MSPLPALRDSSRDNSAALRPCPVCGAALVSTRARYCSHACRQRAYRLAHPASAPDTDTLSSTLRRRRVLAAHTVYECPNCELRLLGERRCPECHLFCRARGPGGTCQDCDAVILLADLLDLAGKEG